MTHHDSHGASRPGRAFAQSRSIERHGALLDWLRHRRSACMVIGTAFGLGNVATIALAVILAFMFGYAFTLVPLLRGGLASRAALPVALASDTASITLMEIVDNAIMLVIPGAMDAGLADPLFWGSLAFCLVVQLSHSTARGHAVVHAYHKH
jgi:hypothetical protein